MINPELKVALLKTTLCRHLDLHELDALLAYSKIVVFNVGDVLLQQGKKSNGAYIVITGSVSVMAKVVGIGVINFVALSEGNFIGEFGMLVDSVSAISAVAQSETKCIFIPNAYFDILALFSPETKFKINMAVIENILVQLAEKYKKITQFMQQSTMLSISIFGEVLHSLAHPKKITLENTEISVDQLQRLAFFNSFAVFGHL